MNPKGGFTLIELVMTMIILGLAALVISSTVTALSHSSDAVVRERGIGLAQALMDEIMAKNWDEQTPTGGGPIISGESSTDNGSSTSTQPCPSGERIHCYRSFHPGHPVRSASTTLGPEEGGSAASRQNWDDVDDYHGASEPVANQFYDQNGQQLSGDYSGFSRQVVVRYIDSDESSIDSQTAASASSSTDSKLVIVTVSTPLGESLNLVAVACNF